MPIALEYMVIAALAMTNLLTLTMLLRHKGTLSTLPSFEQYLAKHGMAKEQGATACKNCGSTSIQVDWKGFDKGLNIHSCRHCGTRLYRS